MMETIPVVHFTSLIKLRKPNPVHTRQPVPSKIPQTRLAQAPSGSGAHQRQARSAVADQHDAGRGREFLFVPARRRARWVRDEGRGSRSGGGWFRCEVPERAAASRAFVVQGGAAKKF